MTKERSFRDKKSQNHHHQEQPETMKLLKSQGLLNQKLYLGQVYPLTGGVVKWSLQNLLHFSSSKETNFSILFWNWEFCPKRETRSVKEIQVSIIIVVEQHFFIFTVNMFQSWKDFVVSLNTLYKKEWIRRKMKDCILKEAYTQHNWINITILSGIQIKWRDWNESLANLILESFPLLISFLPWN